MSVKRIKKIRLSEYDYGSNGYYFVTVVSKQRERLFEGQEKLLESELSDLVEKTKGLALDYFVIMPNHAHIIFVLEASELKLGEIVRRFKAKVSHTMGQNVWQPNYYEHVIRSDEALEKIREYIINNPMTEILKFEQFYGADKSAGYGNQDVARPFMDANRSADPVMRRERR